MALGPSARCLFAEAAHRRLRPRECGLSAPWGDADGGEESFDEFRVPLGAGTVPENGFSVAEGKTLAVGPVAGHRVVGVDDGYDARAERDAISFKTVGVAGAVESLVVVIDDRVGHP